MSLDALLTHCRLADGRLVDIGVAGGRIATIGEDAASSLSAAIWCCPASSMVTCTSTRL
jgi:hypothetical protein